MELETVIYCIILTVVFLMFAVTVFFLMFKKTKRAWDYTDKEFKDMYEFPTQTIDYRGECVKIEDDKMEIPTIINEKGEDITDKCKIEYENGHYTITHP